MNSLKIFVLGPSHHEYIPGCALSLMTEYATPLGNIQVDTQIVEKLRNEHKFLKLTKAADLEEHSIEMHMPFIYKIFSQQNIEQIIFSQNRQPFTIVPIIVGQLSHSEEEYYGKILAEYMDRNDTFFIISSDFSHWGKQFQYTPYNESEGEIYEYIEKLDKKGISLIENHDISGFISYLDETKNTICGQKPISIYLNALKFSKRQEYQTQLVAYSQSEKLTRKHSRQSSVSYAAIVTYKKKD